MKTKKVIMMVLMLVAVMLFLGLSGNVQAATVAEPNRQIAGDFEESFVNTICAKYGITKEQFTWGWAADLEVLDLTDMSIGGIDKNGANPHVLTGYFCNLKVLKVSGNNLGGLPNLPATLEVLDCSNNNITGLPNLSPVLTNLDCSNNKLAELPNLSPVLTDLNCSNNELVALPELAGTLVSLDCSNNKLEALPGVLSPVLENLNASDNELPGLPDLPKTLTSLDVSNNELPGLPDLPEALTNLDVSDNELPGLPDLPATLTSLDVSNNELPGLPALPETLTSLNIKGNSDIAAIIFEQLPAGLTQFESDLVKNSDGDYTLNGESIRYTITVEKVGNGIVKVSKTKAVSGQKVEISAVPEEGYRLKEITGVDGLTEVAEYGYTFIMSEKDITLSVVFEKIPTTGEGATGTETTPEDKGDEKDETPTTGSLDVVLFASAIVAVISVAGIVTVKKYTR